MYELLKNELDGTEFVKKTDGNIILLIPCDSANSDYQRYLAWLENPDAEQSTPPVIE
jgi:hypothetical protein